MDDLVIRLRAGCVTYESRDRDNFPCWPVDEEATEALLLEAAQEIERLRARLQV